MLQLQITYEQWECLEESMQHYIDKCVEYGSFVSADKYQSVLDAINEQIEKQKSEQKQ